MHSSWKQLLPVDRYLIKQNGLLYEYDRKILTLLYQPLIGSLAYSLYMTLWSMLEKDELWGKVATHHSLMTVMDLSLSEILTARRKLEGIGLLKTYVREDQEARTFLYELQPPLSPEQFFQDDLQIFLRNKVGEKRYRAIQRHFSRKSIDTASFRSVTASFNEVYASVRPQEMAEHAEFAIESDVGEPLTRRSNDGPPFSATHFDFELFFEDLSDLIVPREAVTDSVKELVEKLAFIYQLGPLEMSKMVERVYAKHERLGEKELREEAQKWYAFENGDRFPLLVYRTQRMASSKTQQQRKWESKEDKLIHGFETYSPAEFLRARSNGGRASLQDLKLAEQLMIDQKLPPGVVNVLLDFVMQTNDQKLNKNYIDKIAAHWARKNIQTVPEAIELCRSEHERYKQWQNRRGKTKTKNLHREPLPEWIGSSQKQLQQNGEQQAEPNGKGLEEKKRRLAERLQKYRDLT